MTVIIHFRGTQMMQINEVQYLHLQGIAITYRQGCSTTAAHIVMRDISELILGYHKKYRPFNNNTVEF
jgi:hypothetical protein